MLLKADRCLCDVPVNMYYIRIPNTYQLKCKRCKNVVSPLSVTPLARNHKDLTDILDLVCRVYYTKRAYTPVEIAALYQCKYETARRKARRVVNWMLLALINSKGTISRKNINDNMVIRTFSAEYIDLTSAVNALFHALPPLTVAFKNSSSNN